MTVVEMKITMFHYFSLAFLYIVIYVDVLFKCLNCLTNRERQIVFVGFQMVTGSGMLGIRFSVQRVASNSVNVRRCRHSSNNQKTH
jgi:hypothetical protein